MATIYSQVDVNKRKTWLLMSVFLVIVIGVGWTFSYVYDNVIILYAVVAFSLVMNMVSYWKSDKIALAVSGAKTADHEQYKELHRIVENLAITAGLPKPRVYVMQEEAPNAFATGRDPEHSAIAVTTGLLHVLDRTELEGVIAHEISHIGNRDILVSTVAVVLVGSIALISDLFLRSMFWGGGSRDRGGKSGGWLMVIGFVLMVLSPIIASLIQLAISRKREFLADSSGILLTRYPEGLASALEKIAGNSKRMKRASNATAHLFISNPFGAKAKGFLNKMFMTHPPVEERISVLRGVLRP